ncbi:MAG: hypothetical protein OEV28_09845 [Nitrospirota bacterium]|nr:hypothetical protein [Nitrospirota bacterium]
MGHSNDSKTGPIIFWAVTAVVLIFFWWFLINTHGVAPHHGG